MKPEQISQLAKEYEQQSHSILICDADGHIIYQSKSIPNPSAPFIASIMHSSAALVKNSNSLSVSIFGDQSIHIAKKNGYLFALYEKQK